MQLDKVENYSSIFLPDWEINWSIYTFGFVSIHFPIIKLIAFPFFNLTK